MKQMTLIEMNGFLKGKCIPSDLKVNETNAEYLVRKFGEIEAKIALLEVQLKLSEAAERAWESSMMQACGEDGPKSVADKFAELESKLETALRECRSAGITIDNLEAKCAALAVENAALNGKMDRLLSWAGIEFYSSAWEFCNLDGNDALEFICDKETPATDAFLAEVRAQGVEMFAASLKVVGGHEHPYSSLAHEFAAQLRKGGSQ